MTYVVEYSQTQKAFHVEPLQEAISRNVKAMAMGTPSDWILVGQFPTYVQAALFVARIADAVHGPKINTLEVVRQRVNMIYNNPF